MRSAILFAFAVAAGLGVAIFAARSLFVLFSGALFALALNAFASWVARRTHAPYVLALCVCVVLMLGAMVLGFTLTIPALLEEVHPLGVALQKSLIALQRALHIPQLGAMVEGQDVAANIERLASHAFSAAGTSVEILGALVVFFFVGVYGAADPRAYERAVLWFVPPQHRARAVETLSATLRSLQRWLLGRLVAMLFVGIASGIVFAVLDVPLAFPLAVLAGTLTFVEYLGAILSGVLPVLLAFSQSPTRALWVLVTFTVLHVIEGYVLTPLLARTAVRYPPALALAAQVVLGTLAGALGLTFATPLLVVCVTPLQIWRQHAQA